MYIRFVKTDLFKNAELGLELHAWHSTRKDERVFLAREIMKQLGYKGGITNLKIAELEEGVDMMKVTKGQAPEFMQQLHRMNLIGSRTASVIVLYESGVWKLIQQSKKAVGIKTRNWLAREVLPSIRRTGAYNTNGKTPFAFLEDYTERKTQINNSKSVNTKIYLDNGNFAQYHNTIHKLVNGMTAKELKSFYGSKESARELLRKHIPENAATIAVIDELFFKRGMTIDQISKSKVHETLPPAMKSLLECGFDLL